MKKIITLLAIFLWFSSCEEKTEKPENTRGIPGPEKVVATAPDFVNVKKTSETRVTKPAATRKGTAPI